MFSAGNRVEALEDKGAIVRGTQYTVKSVRPSNDPLEFGILVLVEVYGTYYGRRFVNAVPKGEKVQ